MRVAVHLIVAVVGAAVAASAHAADAPSVPTADAAAVRRVIQQQLDAFGKDDARGAFAEASPGIRAQFGDDADTFMAMVRRAYQPVYHPRSTIFGSVSIQGGQVVQKLEIEGADGASHEALYFMEHEPDGSWRIGGCVLMDGGGVGA